MQPARNSTVRSRRPNADFSMPLPRFHPAVYQAPSSSGNSTVTSPRGLRPSPGLKPPTSPRPPSARQYNEATRKLIEYQQEIMRATGAAAAPKTKLPHTPSLAPALSPGPATPLTLEEPPSDYLTAGAIRRGVHHEVGSHRELVEKMILEEQERQSEMRSGPSSAPVSPPAAS